MIDLERAQNISEYVILQYLEFPSRVMPLTSIDVELIRGTLFGIVKQERAPGFKFMVAKVPALTISSFKHWKASRLNIDSK